MVFASPLFIFLFLPLTLAAYFVFPRRWRNGVLLVASLAFYSWGEARYVALVLASVAFNWWMGLAIAGATESRLRKRWLALLLVIGVLVVGISLLDLPFAKGRGAGRTVVKVTGGQFFWSLVPNKVPAGTRIRFDVSSIDVNHGFGLYDPHGHLIGSVQAMPGYHNKLDLTLTEAGVYQIRCLEFCGLNHSIMESSMTVVPSR